MDKEVLSPMYNMLKTSPIKASERDVVCTRYSINVKDEEHVIHASCDVPLMPHA